MTLLGSGILGMGPVVGANHFDFLPGEYDLGAALLIGCESGEGRALRCRGLASQSPQNCHGAKQN
jgi:hypothetical protein